LGFLIEALFLFNPNYRKMEKALIVSHRVMVLYTPAAYSANRYTKQFGVGKYAKVQNA